MDLSVYKSMDLSVYKSMLTRTVRIHVHNFVDRLLENGLVITGENI
jgi:hypothetical protein